MASSVNKKNNSAAQSATGVINCLKVALEDPDLHDFNLLCRGRVFPCSKFVLAARSPVFKALIKEDSIRNGGVIAVESCSAEAMEIFLQLLYTGKSKFYEADENAM